MASFTLILNESSSLSRAITRPTTTRGSSLVFFSPSALGKSIEREVSNEVENLQSTLEKLRLEVGLGDEVGRYEQRVLMLDPPPAASLVFAWRTFK